MITVILQTVEGEKSNFESRAIRMAAMLMDGVRIVNSTIDCLGDQSQSLRAGALPVGSVEFVRKAFDLAGIEEPDNLSYPPGCEAFLHRKMDVISAANALTIPHKRFLKSTTTKAFTGFVLDPDSGARDLSDLSDLSDHDLQQRHLLGALAEKSPNEPVWIGEPVIWRSEWRYYVADSQIMGSARCDLNEDEDAPEPDIGVVLDCIHELEKNGLTHPYALDFGVLNSGKSAIVEVNDAWAIGLYEGAMAPKDYLGFLLKRWDSFYSRAVNLDKIKI